jgi:hypothetical protein
VKKFLLGFLIALLGTGVVIALPFIAAIGTAIFIFVLILFASVSYLKHAEDEKKIKAEGDSKKSPDSPD